jgi:hypothetical protein
MKRPLLFSERFGFTERVVCTTNDPLPAELRRALWNDYFQIAMEGNVHCVGFSRLSVQIWTSLMGRAVDELSSQTPAQTYQWIKGAFQTYDWTHVFNIIEFTFPHLPHDSFKNNLREKVNESLSDFSSDYRIIDNFFVSISDEEQVREIDAALKIPLKPVKDHLTNSLRFLRDSSSPTAPLDSIRESIHAVESMCQLLTGEPNDSLGKALNKLKGKIAIPEELEHSLHRLYGFTSNAQGVRHAIFDEANLTLREARFMIVACSAFVTYLWDLAIAGGLNVT